MWFCWATLFYNATRGSVELFLELRQRMAFLETAGNTVIQIFGVRGNERFWNAVSTFFQGNYQIAFAPHVLCFASDHDNFGVGENDLDGQVRELFCEIDESFVPPGFDIGYQLVHSVGRYRVHRLFAFLSNVIGGSLDSLDMCLVCEGYGKWDSV